MEILCLSTKFSHHEIRWNYGILGSVKFSVTFRIAFHIIQLSYHSCAQETLGKKWSFPLRISSVNVAKSAGNIFLCSESSAKKRRFLKTLKGQITLSNKGEKKYVFGKKISVKRHFISYTILGLLMLRYFVNLHLALK